MKSNSKNRLVIDTKSSLIYQKLKQNIFDGRLQPGEKLIASKIADSYGISMIPVREAFSLLIAEGLLTNIPHKGTYVTEIEIEDLEKMYPIGAILEGYAAREASAFLKRVDFDRLSQLLHKMERASENANYSEMSRLHYEFHMTIYRASKNEELVRIIDDLWRKTGRARIFGLVPVRAIRSIPEHKLILEALKNKDKLEAERLIIEQKKRASRAVIVYLEKKKKTKMAVGD